MPLQLLKSSPAIPANHLPPILFVHGAWHGAWCWEENFVPYFTKNGYETYTFDLKNHGLSKSEPHINQVRLKDYLNDLETAIAQIGKPCILVGHSMGGFIIQRYLEKNDCLAIILMASVPRNGILRLNFKMWQLFPKSMVKMWLFMELFQIVNTPQNAKKCFFSEDISADKLKKYTAQLGGESMKVMVFDLLFARLKKRKNQQFPLLVQSAGKDQVVTINENKDTAIFQNGDYQFYPNLAHDMMLEQNWELSAGGILDWLTVKFPIQSQQKTVDIEKKSTNMRFSDAIPNLITKLGENINSNDQNTKILGMGKSERDN